MTSALHGPAWPESRGFGLARAGFGFVKSQARPRLLKEKYFVIIYLYIVQKSNLCAKI